MCVCIESELTGDPWKAVKGQGLHPCAQVSEPTQVNSDLFERECMRKKLPSPAHPSLDGGGDVTVFSGVDFFKHPTLKTF